MIPYGEDGDYYEKPICEQFKTVWDPKSKSMITEPVEIAA